MANYIQSNWPTSDHIDTASYAVHNINYCIIKEHWKLLYKTHVKFFHTLKDSANQIQICEEQIRDFMAIWSFRCQDDLWVQCVQLRCHWGCREYMCEKTWLWYTMMCESGHWEVHKHILHQQRKGQTQHVHLNLLQKSTRTLQRICIGTCVLCRHSHTCSTYAVEWNGWSKWPFDYFH